MLCWKRLTTSKPQRSFGGQLPPDKLFGKEEADLALRYAEDVYFWCSPVSYDGLY
jgi:hypothetical protein